MSDHDPHAFTSGPGSGHNKPPRAAFEKARNALTVAEDLASRISVIRNEDDADRIAAGIRAVQNAWEELNYDREVQVRPLNARVQAINGEYRAPLQAFKTIEDALKSINRVWLLAQDKLREAEAKRLREEAEAKAEIARKAQEEAEREAERAKDGDVTEGPLRPVEAARDAQQATLAARKAEAAATALENSSVTSGGGDTRAVGLRTREVLTIATTKDMIKVVTNIGIADKDLVEDVIKACRRFKKKRNMWPIGLTVTQEKV